MKPFFHFLSDQGEFAKRDLRNSFSFFTYRTYDPLIRDDIEQTSPASTKRFVQVYPSLFEATSSFFVITSIFSYVALRWSTPSARKKKSRAKNPAVNADGTPSRRGTKSKSQESNSPEVPDQNKDKAPVLFREGKTLSGFIIAEHDVSLSLSARSSQASRDPRLTRSHSAGIARIRSSPCRSYRSNRCWRSLRCNLSSSTNPYRSSSR